MNGKKLLNTEKILPKHFWIDQLKIDEGIDLILTSQQKSLEAVKSAKKQIQTCVNKVLKVLKGNNKGSIVYLGAGTSGRLGVLDGAEIPPTFGWNKKRIKFIIAGGKRAMFQSSEGAEDLKHFAVDEIKKLKLNKNDVLIALSASGSTKYTISGLEEANNLGVLTIGISNNINSELLKKSKIPIFLDTGTEVVAGSTRMAAGTAQKICLNIISTLVMTKLGMVKNGMMIKIKPKNNKLKNRLKIIQSLL